MGREITFVGIRKDVERLYAPADIFVLPSKYEAFGQVILEAMAAGLPCIAFKRVLPEYQVASEEIIEDGVTGFCVDPFSKDELRDRLLYLIDHPDVRKKMGKMGRKACQTRFTWEGHVTRVLKLVND
jgi:glycosyltransferase involved in cell wall biosynthesis